MGYDPVTMHFTQADTIVQGFSFALSYNRYSYVLYNPINANDPSGYLACSDDGYCGSLGSVGYQRHIYTEAITEVYDWTLEGKWQLQELKYIYQAGYAIETYVNQVTNSDKGVSWMNKFMGRVTFTHDSLVRIILPNNSFALPGNKVVLFDGWEKGIDPARYVAHELGHIWDNNSTKSGMGTYDGGGNGDELNKYLWENSKDKDTKKNPYAPNNSLRNTRWINPDSDTYVNPFIPNDFVWKGKNSYYGNGCTADYFAETFSYGIFDSGVVPDIALLWMTAIINLEVAKLP